MSECLVTKPNLLATNPARLCPTLSFFFVLFLREYDRLLKELRDREVARFGEACPLCPLDLDDVSLEQDRLLD